MQTPLNFGLIGCGVWGAVHARTCAASPLAHLLAVCDQDEARAQNFAQQYGASSCVTDWRQLLAIPQLDAILVVTPDFAHTEILLAALQAKKHVLVEKPLALTEAECHQILAARDDADVKLMVDFHNRWNIPFIHVRRMVQSGELGELLTMNIRLNDTRYVPTKLLSWAARSSVLHFLGSHVVDLVRWIADTEVKSVFSVSRSVVLRALGIDTPDFYQSILELSSGGTALVENCWIVAENAPSLFDFKAEFVGTKGSVYVDVSHHRMIEKYTEDGPGLLDVSGAVDLYGEPTGFCTAPVKHFIDCVAREKTPQVTGEDGLMATRVVEAMQASAKTGEKVDVQVAVPVRADDE